MTEQKNDAERKKLVEDINVLSDKAGMSKPSIVNLIVVVAKKYEEIGDCSAVSTIDEFKASRKSCRKYKALSQETRKALSTEAYNVDRFKKDLGRNKATAELIALLDFIAIVLAEQQELFRLEPLPFTLLPPEIHESMVEISKKLDQILAEESEKESEQKK